MITLFYILLLTPALLLVHSCQDVLDHCFSGQFVYTDPRYVPVNIYLSVLLGNSSGDIDVLCRQYDGLKTCVTKYILFCPPGNSLWEQWSATLLLNDSLCSPTVGNKSQSFERYKSCIQDDDVAGEVDTCSVLLSWDNTSFSAILAEDGLQQRCTVFEDKYVICMEDLVTNRCLGSVTNWLKKYFAGSYLLQVCHNKFGYRQANCLNSNPRLDEEIKQCKATYDADLISLLSSAIPGQSSYIAKTCFIVRKYAKCELDATAKYCGMRTAESERQRLDDSFRSQLHLLQCRLDDIIIEAPSDPVTSQPGLASSDCEIITIQQCRSLPYNSTNLPNIFRHHTVNDAQQAMNRMLAQDLDARCSPVLSCFVCMLHFPVCTVLDSIILPCRGFCESIKASCGVTWMTDVSCDMLPTNGICLNDGNCQAETNEVFPSTEKPKIRPKPLPVKQLPKDIIIIIVGCTTGLVISAVIAISVVIIKKRCAKQAAQFRETDNPLYGTGSIAPSQCGSFDSGSNYWTIPDNLFNGGLLGDGNAVVPDVAPRGPAPSSHIESNEMVTVVETPTEAANENETINDVADSSDKNSIMSRSCPEKNSMEMTTF